MARMLPFHHDNFYFGDETILMSDNDLKKMGLYVENSKIYDFKDELLSYWRDDEPKQDYIESHDDKVIYKHFRSLSDAASGLGSDCFIVHGQHTANKMPIVACDPHLVKWVHSKWYMAHLQWGDNYVMGAGIPGIPFIPYGRTKHGAYGVTALNSDVTDIYEERIEGDKYFYEGEWHTMKSRTHHFKVRFEADHEVVYNYTANGVIMNPLHGEGKKLGKFFPHEWLNFNNKTYSLRWIYNEKVNTANYLTGFRDLLESKTG